MGVNIATNAKEGIVASDFVLLALKPAIIRGFLEENKEYFSGKTVISIAASVPVSLICEVLGENTPAIRIMPNTPILVGMGVMVYSKNESVDDTGLNSFLTAVSNAGLVEEIAEENIDAETAVAGCGPAFVYMFTAALAEGGVRAGLSHEAAIRYAAATVKGAGEMILKDNRTPEELCQAVCSPGGSTIEGVNFLRDADFASTVADAVITSFEKTKKLGK